MAFLGDAANFVLGGIPGDVHDIFTPDVDPSELMKASEAMTDLADTVASVHLQLNDGIAMVRGRWEGDGAAAFQTDIWQPLSDGLDVLEGESHNAASQLANLAGQAAEEHMAKISAIEQELQTQLNITAVTFVLTPAAGRAIAEMVTNVASRFAGDALAQIVKGIVKAIEDVLKQTLKAFADLFARTLEPLSRSLGQAFDGASSYVDGKLRDVVAGLGVPASTARTVEKAIRSLQQGRNPGIYVVRSDVELRRLFDELSAGGSPVSNSYRGRFVRFPDGTTVGMRATSSSGGPAIDVKLPDETILKVHVDP